MRIGTLHLDLEERIIYFARKKTDLTVVLSRGGGISSCEITVASENIAQFLDEHVWTVLTKESFVHVDYERSNIECWIRRKAVVFAELKNDSKNGLFWLLYFDGIANEITSNNFISDKGAHAWLDVNFPQGWSK